MDDSEGGNTNESPDSSGESSSSGSSGDSDLSGSEEGSEDDYGFFEGLLIDLFVPSAEFWVDKFAFMSNVKTTLESYEKLKDTFISVFDEYGHYDSETGKWTSTSEIAGPPDFTIELFGAEVKVVNWEPIAPYLEIVKSIVVFISYTYFIYWLIRRIAGVIYND